MNKAEKKRMIDAKIKMLKELSRQMGDMLSVDEEGEMDMLPKSMKKVTVTANSAQGLKKGLEKAEDVLEMMPEDEMLVDSEDKEEDEDEEEEEA